MSFVDPNTVHNPAPNTVAPAAWGDVVRDDLVDLHARGLVALAETSTDQNSISSADLTGLTVTITVVAGSRIRLSYYEPNPTGSGAADDFEFRIQEGATVLQAGVFSIASGNDHNRPVHISRILSPSAGAHTYKMAVARTSGAGTLSLDRGATYPAYLAAEDLGRLP